MTQYAFPSSHAHDPSFLLQPSISSVVNAVITPDFGEQSVPKLVVTGLYLAIQRRRKKIHSDIFDGALPFPSNSPMPLQCKPAALNMT